MQSNVGRRMQAGGKVKLETQTEIMAAAAEKHNRQTCKRTPWMKRTVEILAPTRGDTAA